MCLDDIRGTASDESNVTRDAIFDAHPKQDVYACL